MGFFNRSKKEPQAPASSKASPSAKATGDKPADKAEPKKEAPAYVARATGDAYRVLVRPIVTEKTTALGKLGQYAFEVAMDANKIEVRKALKSVYGVDATDVRVMRVLGKPVRSRRGMSRRSAWRKAIVTLKKGESIDLYANS